MYLYLEVGRRTFTCLWIVGSEFVAMKQGIDALRDLKYNCRMMGIPKSGLSSIFGDNMSGLHNTSRQE